MEQAKFVNNGVLALLDGMGTTNAWNQTKLSNPRYFVDHWSKVLLDLEGSARSDAFHQNLMAQIGIETPELRFKARLFQDTVVVFSTVGMDYFIRLQGGTFCGGNDFALSRFRCVLC